MRRGIDSYGKNKNISAKHLLLWRLVYTGAVGCYICEDLHTSYWERFGGRYKDESTFVEYSKNFIDYINAWNSETPELTENTYSRTMHGVHYYTSMLVIEKEKVGYPRELMIGHEY